MLRFMGSQRVIHDCVTDPVTDAAAANSLQSCPTLCDPMECSLLGSSVRRIFQARVLEWVAISFSMTDARQAYNKILVLKGCC